MLSFPLVLLMVVDSSGLWPIPAVSLDTSCITLVTSLSAGVGAGSLVTSLCAGIGGGSLVASLSAGVDVRRQVTGTRLATGCPHGVCLETTLVVLLMVVDTSDLWPIPAVSLDTSCIPLVTSLSAGIGAGSLVTSLSAGVDVRSLVSTAYPWCRRHIPGVDGISLELRAVGPAQPTAG
uniref:hypothetical protein n=1 Tax=Tessaracoccus bendigoensis TaxID=72764 RepID=UPI001114AA55|nr:hypothetical protein [Tessaracoccus bendigoensis]